MKYLTFILLLSVATLCALKDVFCLICSKLLLTKLPSLLKLEDNHLEILSLIFMEELSPKLFKILLDCAKETTQLENMQVVLSIESFPTSWFREEILLEEMELEADQYLETDLMTKTLYWSTSLCAFQWQMQDLIQMEASSSSLPQIQAGLMADM